ncbi:MAG: metal-sulfur cluster assembly factor [Thermoleophilia bacterium]
MVSVEQIWEALHAVIDPELGLDFVDLGLVYDVVVEGADVHVVFTLTTPACGIGPAVAEEIDEIVGAMDGVRSVFPRMTFEPPWTPARMSEDAKFALGL